MNSVLTINGVSKSFPGVHALSDVNFSLDRGEIHALVGENGAGKSTLMKILSGIYRPDKGEIVVDGSPRKFFSYRDATAAGIATIFQEFSLIPYLDAVENIFLGHEPLRAGFIDRRRMRLRAAEIFRRLGFEIDLDVQVWKMSIAQQQFVEIAKALALDAKILVLDEPTATLTPNETEHLFTVMRELKSQGVSMIFISHHLDEVFTICERATVLRDGRNVGTRETGQLDSHQLIEMMVGRALEATFPARSAPPGRGEVLLEVRHLQLTEQGADNALSVHAGEILGIAGLVGSGRTEFALALIGATTPHQKNVFMDGKTVALRSPADAVKAGIGLLPEDRKSDGLIQDFSIERNIVLNNFDQILKAGVLVDQSKATGLSDRAMRTVALRAPSSKTVVGTLSGGNQQKAVLARWLCRHSRVLIFDEPTRGIDVGARAEIYALMRAFVEQGRAIIMISSDLAEIIGMCDRVAVFREGRIVAVLEGPVIESGDVMRHATGFQHEAA